MKFLFNLSLKKSAKCNTSQVNNSSIPWDDTIKANLETNYNLVHAAELSLGNNFVQTNLILERVYYLLDSFGTFLSGES